MLNDALNMPRRVFPLLSTGKREKREPSAPFRPYCRQKRPDRAPRRYCSSNVYLSKRKERSMDWIHLPGPLFRFGSIAECLVARSDSFWRIEMSRQFRRLLSKVYRKIWPISKGTELKSGRDKRDNRDFEMRLSSKISQMCIYFLSSSTLDSSE